jgi:3-isopropylmalate/(R)-2-methylmalate dehydratase large subunit
MTICNMSVEGGARAGYVNPDETTYEWLRGTDAFDDSEERRSSGSRTRSGDSEERFDELREYWESIRSGPDAEYDDVVTVDGSAIEPVVTWGTTPGQVVGVTEPIPDPDDLPEGEREVARRAQAHTGVTPGETMRGYPVDVAFLGSCTNARLSDLRDAAEVVRGRTVDDDVRAMVVPGSQRVAAAAEREGLDDVFRAAGFDWRAPGCSMCLGMNDDQLVGDEVCASSSNRNFVGRQGSKEGRTVLMSPRMVAAAAVTGRVTDVRDLPTDDSDGTEAVEA